MTMTLPEDKKDFVKKEIKAVGEKLVVVNKFEEKVSDIIFIHIFSYLCTFDHLLLRSRKSRSLSPVWTTLTRP